MRGLVECLVEHAQVLHNHAVDEAGVVDDAERLGVAVR